MTAKTRHVVVSGGFDDIRSRDLRFLEEASRIGPVTVLLTTDEAIQAATGSPAGFPFAERRYLLGALRYVSDVLPIGPNADALPSGTEADVWAGMESRPSEFGQRYCHARGLPYHVFSDDELRGFPVQTAAPSSRKKVVVTGSYDWLHSGHVRFFEEASSYGDLYVVVGHDANIRLLKGQGHPLLSEQERRYAVGAIRYVTQALISSGNGWLDAEPEIAKLKPDIYVVNEDGDKGGKREFCRAYGIEYVVLQRIPAPGLPRRSSTDLRGF